MEKLTFKLYKNYVGVYFSDWTKLQKITEFRIIVRENFLGDNGEYLKLLGDGIK